MPAPVSFAQTAFHVIHALRFANASDEAQYLSILRGARDRSCWTEDGRSCKKQPPSYLFEEMEARLRKAPVVFNLVLQPTKEWDPTDDPTAPWPDDSHPVGIGRLKVRRPTTVEEEIGDPVMLHDPTRLKDGIEASDDPILAVHRGVYEVPRCPSHRWLEGTSGRSGPGDHPFLH